MSEGVAVGGGIDTKGGEASEALHEVEVIFPVGLRLAGTIREGSLGVEARPVCRSRGNRCCESEEGGEGLHCEAEEERINRSGGMRR